MQLGYLAGGGKSKTAVAFTKTTAVAILFKRAKFIQAHDTAESLGVSAPLVAQERQ